MSALGHYRTFGKTRLMSALPPKADIDHVPENVGFVPIADIERNCSSARSLTNPAAGLWVRSDAKKNKRRVTILVALSGRC
jgi:hypothetical protein